MARVAARPLARLALLATLVVMVGCRRKPYVDYEYFVTRVVEPDVVAFDATSTGMVVATRTGLRTHDQQLTPGGSAELGRPVVDVRRWDDDRVLVHFEGEGWSFVGRRDLAVGSGLAVLSTGRVLGVGRTTALLLAPDQAEYVVVRGRDGDQVRRYPCQGPCPAPEEARLNAQGTVAFIPDGKSGWFLRTETGEEIATELERGRRFGPVIFSADGNEVFGRIETTVGQRLFRSIRPLRSAEWKLFAEVDLRNGWFSDDTRHTKAWRAYYTTGAWSGGFKVFGGEGVTVMKDHDGSAVHYVGSYEGTLRDEVDRVRIVGDRFACAHATSGLYCWEVPPFWRGLDDDEPPPVAMGR